MDKDMFKELMTSAQQMDDIVKGKKNTSRSFDFPDPEHALQALSA